MTKCLSKNVHLGRCKVGNPSFGHEMGLPGPLNLLDGFNHVAVQPEVSENPREDWEPPEEPEQDERDVEGVTCMCATCVKRVL